MGTAYNGGDVSQRRDKYAYYAFLSYSRKDDRVAAWLHRGLEAYRVPKDLLAADGQHGPRPRRLSPVFRDRTDLSSGGDLTDKLVDALRASEFLVVLCSPSSAQSDYVNAEVETFLADGRADRVFPVIVSGEPNSGDPATECLPPALREANLLASDLRDIRLKTGQRIGDGREAGKAKLIAGLLDVPLDVIAQRERRRANRRALFATMASVVFFALAVVAAAASWIALENQREADRQAGIATASSDFLVDLFEAGAPAQKNPDDVTAREVLDLGATRIGNEFAQQPDLKATLTGMISRAYLDLGAYGAGVDLVEAERPTLAQAGEEGVRALIVLSRLYLATEELSKAENAILQALERLDALSSRDHALRAYAYETYGAVLDALQRPEEALERYDLALDEQSKLDPPEPENSISTLSERALILIDLEYLQDADADLRLALEYAEEVSGPESLRVMRILTSLARNTLYLGDPEDPEHAAEKARQALHYIERAQSIAERLLDADNPIRGDILSLKGEILDILGSPDAALEAFNAALAIPGRPTNAIGDTRYALGVFHYYQNDFEAALAEAKKAFDAYQATRKPDLDKLARAVGLEIEALQELDRWDEANSLCNEWHPTTKDEFPPDSQVSGYYVDICSREP